MECRRSRDYNYSNLRTATALYSHRRAHQLQQNIRVTVLDKELYARLHQDTCGQPSPASHFSSGIRSPPISPRHLLFSSPPPSIRPTLPSRKMM
ncbi:hypothetical protein DPX16_11002 [Anabarilius grahami]|uniref:Uncharacterized protein n=1 Tax=Anabarilius grahami TaxID=495550 RepID=A0A3N0Y9P1_ANAGA|nr:hypothetical protein DPX16_11002 [Anabarilius grahami]